MLHHLQGFAERGAAPRRTFFDDASHREIIRTALRIRAVETVLFEAFGKGMLHGTIHTCIGQEFSGAVLCSQLGADDFVTSNHRCHGHFIATTGKWRELIDELVGNVEGVCAGIGSSQHLCDQRFISNGPQGALLPVAAGVSLDRKLAHRKAVVVSFIGEGTLGEGILYETLNLASLWGLPHLIVCENNGYSQSTPQDHALAGDIASRAEAFGVKVFDTDTWNLPWFFEQGTEAIRYVRENSKPAFLIHRTYRLNPHSKGDDKRDPSEIRWFTDRDPLNLAIGEGGEWVETYDQFLSEARGHFQIALQKPGLPVAEYLGDQLPSAANSPLWTVHAPIASSERGVSQINRFYGDWLREDASAVFLGEDVADPYGGAFKVSKGFSTEFPERVLTTPISEAAITGIGIGLALTGRRSFVEIMFGDFLTLSLDQLINNASKFHHMFNRQVSAPVVVRTPMGGRRGYGPTHSESLERFCLGIDNTCVVSPNSLAPLLLQLQGLKSLRCPAVVAENKVDYTQRDFDPPPQFVIEVDGELFPTVRIRPANSKPNLTILTYGGMARFIADRLLELFEDADAIVELIVPTCLRPWNFRPTLESAERTGTLLVVEEGPVFAGFSAEAAVQTLQAATRPIRVERLGRDSAPVPSAPALEAEVLPGATRLAELARSLLHSKR